MSDNKIKEEVSITPIIQDLERLFNRIGRSIRSFGKGISKGISSFILFTFKNFKFLLIGGIIGGVIGIFSYSIFPKTYSSSLTLTTNIEASDQLFADISYYNALINSPSKDEIKAIFKIDDTIAESLVGISVESNSTLEERIYLIDSYNNNLDSSTTALLDFDKILNGEEPSLSKRFTIHAYSKDPTIFSAIEGPMIEHMENDPDLQVKRMKEIDILNYRIKILSKQLSNLDSLKTVYNEVLLRQSESNDNNITTLKLSNSKENQLLNPLDIYKEYMEYSLELSILEDKRKTTEKCYYVHSHFNGYGSLYSIGRTMRILIGISIFVGLTYLFLLLARFIKTQK